MTKDMRNLLDAITWDHKAPEAPETTNEVLTESADEVVEDEPSDEVVEESAERDPLEEAMRNEYVAFMEGEEEPEDEELVNEERVGESVSHLITTREDALKRSEERRRAKGLTAKAKAETKK